MKTKTGFVSNSSSSSFIVGFDEKPKTVEEMKEVLFGDSATIRHPFEDINMDTMEIAETVFNDIKCQAPNDRDGLVEEITSGSCYGQPDYCKIVTADFNNRELYDKQCVAHDRLLKEWGVKKVGSLITANPTKVFFVVEYSDNDSNFGCGLEHGDVFHAIPHYRISKH